VAQCEVCGNEYHGAFTVIQDGEPHVFDSFECAIHALAPTCEHCGCRVIGHGVESGSQMFCSYCAHAAANLDMVERIRDIPVRTDAVTGALPDPAAAAAAAAP
jgi:hypothetical protein